MKKSMLNLKTFLIESSFGSNLACLLETLQAFRGGHHLLPGTALLLPGLQELLLDLSRCHTEELGCNSSKSQCLQDAAVQFGVVLLGDGSREPLAMPCSETIAIRHQGGQGCGAIRLLKETTAACLLCLSWWCGWECNLGKALNFRKYYLLLPNILQESYQQCLMVF